MKFFIAFALIATVASAAYIKPTQLNSEIAEIVAAIQSPSTDPATAAALEAMLLDVMGISPSPIAVGPAIIDSNPISVGPAIIEANPIAVGPAIIDFPLPDGGAVSADEPAPVVPSPVIEPSPVVIGEIPAGATPLVQIIVNVNKAESVVAPAPVGTPVIDEVYVPGPVNVVDNVVLEPVIQPIVVVEPVVPGPVNVVDGVVLPVAPIQVIEPVVPGPVNVVDGAAIPVAPIQVVEPVVPGPVNVVDGVVIPVEPVQVLEPIVVSPVVVGAPIIN